MFNWNTPHGSRMSALVILYTTRWVSHESFMERGKQHCAHPLTSQERKQKRGGGRETPRKGTLKTRTSSPSDHWQVWKQTIRRQESGLEPGIIHSERYTCIRFQCGCSHHWAILSLMFKWKAPHRSRMSVLVIGLINTSTWEQDKNGGNGKNILAPCILNHHTIGTWEERERTTWLPVADI